MTSSLRSGLLGGLLPSVFAVLIAAGLSAHDARAQAPDSLSFQGFLTKPDGTPLDSTVSITFKLYKDGAAVWTETQPSVTVTDGIFNVLLGGVTPLDTVPFDQPMDLGVTVGADPEVTPRTPLAAAAFALGMRGIYAVQVADASYEGFNVIGGAPNNSVAAGVVGATIGGGGGLVFGEPRLNTVTGDWGTVGGGFGNTASGLSSTVGGGQFSTAGAGGTVGGGLYNTTSGQSGTVGGGFGSTASDSYATVGGGSNNTASNSAATVGGGFNNTAGGINATVPGGFENRAVGHASFAAGYRARAVHDGTFAWNDRSITMGDDSLVSTGDNQFLIRAAGGVGIGTNSPNRELTIFDGDDDGDAILNLKASNASARELLVGVNQSTGGLISMETDNNLQFRTSGAARITIEAGGEVGIGTISPAHPLHMASGAHVTAGGIWTSVSSRELKQGFEAVEGRDVLDAVASLPVTRWRYKNEEGAVHMGPVAEDFYAAFGLGADDKHIASLDGNGVALAAIQGLYELVRELQAENERMRESLRRAGLE